MTFAYDGSRYKGYQKQLKEKTIQGEIEKALKSDKTISGEIAFKLYDTYGFPYELTKEISEEKGVSVDEVGFKKAMQEQKDRARSAMQKVTITDDLAYINNPKTEFIGYDEYSGTGKILAIVDENCKNVDVAQNGVFDIILDKTPFYAECGGQVGDSGTLKIENASLEVVKTFKVQDIFVHRTIVKDSTVNIGDVADLKIDCARRKEITKHHSLAHLLQAALQNVLGKEVHQAGSYVEENKTRYDFTFDRALKPEEIKEVVYQSTAYLGIARVFPFLQRTNEMFKALNIEESKESRLTNTQETRQPTGTEAQVKIFGEGMKDFYKGGTVNYWLASNCFGDYYTRKGLNLTEREMITFCFLLAQGGCESQLRSHIQGNINVGNDPAFLRKVVEQMVPYIGYPRSLNAFACIKEFE